MAEFDGKAPGPFRGRIAECQHEWMNTLEQPAQDTRAQGQLPADSDPRQLAFELEGALLTANWNYHLYADPGHLSRARRAVQARLVSEATPAGRRALRSAPQTGETSSTGDRATRREQR
jgi:hypothetical protein